MSSEKAKHLGMLFETPKSVRRAYHLKLLFVLMRLCCIIIVCPRTKKRAREMAIIDCRLWVEDET